MLGPLDRASGLPSGPTFLAYRSSPPNDTLVCLKIVNHQPQAINQASGFGLAGLGLARLATGDNEACAMERQWCPLGAPQNLTSGVL